MRGQVTGQVWIGAAPNFKGTGQHDVLFQSPDLPILNSNCHMNFVIIWNRTYPSPRYGTPDIWLITEILICNIILRADKYTTRAFCPTRHYSINQNKAFNF